MTQVLLRIYEFELFSGLTEYHSEIIAFNQSYSYSDEGIEVSVVLNKDGLEGYTLKATYDLGFSEMYDYEFEEFNFPAIMDDYTAESYNLFHRNCRFFSLEILNILKPSNQTSGTRVLQELNKMSLTIERYVRPLQLIFNPFGRLYITYVMLSLLHAYYYVINNFHSKSKDYLLIVLFIVLTIHWVSRR